MSGGGQNTVQTQSAPPPEFMAAYEKALQGASNATANPFAQPVAPVAGLSDNQKQGIAGVNNLQGTTQQYLQGAQNYLDQSNTPLVSAYLPNANHSISLYDQSVAPYASQIGQYMSPYTKSVVDATQAQFNNANQQQQQAVAGNAISSGAWGSDRSAVAQALTAGQQQLSQAPVIAGLNQSGYFNAQQELNQQEALKQSAAAGINNVNALGLQAGEAQNNQAMQRAQIKAAFGNQALNGRLSESNALLGAGGLQQAQQQAEMNAPYQWELARQADPYQKSQFYTSAAEGLGSGAGGSSSTKSPGPSTASQIAGAGVTALGTYGMLAAMGVKDGGEIPRRGIGGGLGIPPPPHPAGQDPSLQSQMQNAMSMMRMGQGIGAMSAKPSAGIGGDDMMPVPPVPPPPDDPRWAGIDMGSSGGGEGGSGMAFGGAPRPRISGIGIASHSYRPPVHSFADGGPLPLRAYQSGGGIAAFAPGGGLDDDLAAPLIPVEAEDLPMPPVPPAPSPSYLARFGEPIRANVRPGDLPPLQEQGGIAAAPTPAPGDEDLPVPPIQQGPTPDQGPVQGGGIAGPGQAAAVLNQHNPSWWAQPQHHDLAMTILAAGLGIMGGNSPNAMVNIGQGGLQGLQFGSQLASRRATEGLRAAEMQGNQEYKRAMAAAAQQRANTGEDRAQTYAAVSQARSSDLMAHAALMSAKAAMGNSAHATAGDIEDRAIKNMIGQPNPDDEGKPFNYATARMAQQGLYIRQKQAEIAQQRATQTGEYQQGTVDARKQNANTAEQNVKQRGEYQKDSLAIRDTNSQTAADLAAARIKAIEGAPDQASKALVTKSTDADLRTAAMMSRPDPITGKPVMTYEQALGKVHDARGTPSAVSAPPMALPAKKTDLIPGKVYQTQRGAATWDGSIFTPLRLQ